MVVDLIEAGRGNMKIAIQINGHVLLRLLLCLLGKNGQIMRVAFKCRPQLVLLMTNVKKRTHNACDDEDDKKKQQNRCEAHY